MAIRPSGRHLDGSKLDERVQEVLRSLEPTTRKYYNIGPDAGRLLHMIVRLMGARSILEVGTSNGYSTIWFAEAMRQCGGRVLSLENHRGRHTEAEQNLARAGLSDWVELRLGDARQIASELAGPYDVIFLDADKKDYLGYAQTLLPLLRSGGLLIGDDAIKLHAELRDFIAFVESHPALDSFVVPLNDGFTLSIKL